LGDELRGYYPNRYHVARGERIEGIIFAGGQGFTQPGVRLGDVRRCRQAGQRGRKPLEEGARQLRGNRPHDFLYGLLALLPAGLLQEQRVLLLLGQDDAPRSELRSLFLCNPLQRSQRPSFLFLGLLQAQLRAPGQRPDLLKSSRGKPQEPHCIQQQSSHFCARVALEPGLPGDACSSVFTCLEVGPEEPGHSTVLVTSIRLLEKGVILPHSGLSWEWWNAETPGVWP
jgi:hypothetical protein